MAAPTPVDPLKSLLNPVNTVPAPASLPTLKTMATPEQPTTRPIADAETPEVASSAVAPTTQAPSPSAAAPSTLLLSFVGQNAYKQHPRLQHHLPLPPLLLPLLPRLHLRARQCQMSQVAHQLPPRPMLSRRPRLLRQLRQPLRRPRRYQPLPRPVLLLHPLRAPQPQALRQSRR
jgi:hypothetical protein